MSAASETRIFGIKVGVDPKWIVGGLIVVALAVFFFNMRSSDSSGPSSASTGFHTLPTAPPSARRSVRARRARASITNDRGVLRIPTVDATRGDIDPTLRLDLLARLQSVPEAKVTRSLFELQAAPEPTLEKIKELNQQVVPTPIAPPPVVAEAAKPMAPQVNIPLKFYGFVKPAGHSSVNRGLFLEGDNVVVATEGELVDHRYLVVELTPTTARMSDTEVKQEQTIPLTPASTPQ